MRAENIKLLRILPTLTPEDWISFNLFVHSPYFVTGRNYEKIFKQLHIEYKSRKVIDEISYNRIIEKVFGKGKINEQTVRNRMSEFTTLTETFIKYKYFSEDKFGMDYYLLKHYTEYSLYKEFDSVFNSEDISLNPAEITSKDYTNLIYIQELQLIKEFEEKKFQEAYAGFGTYSLMKTASLLKDIYYFGEQFYNLDKINVEFEFNPAKKILAGLNIEGLIKEIERLNLPFFTGTLLQYYVYELKVNKAKDLYLDKFEALFFNKDIKYSSEVKHDISGKIENYYMTELNNGEIKYIRPLFRLYENRLINGRIDRSNHSGHTAQIFDNYVSIGLRAGEYEKVKEFIELNLDLIPPNSREDMYILSMVRVFTEKREFRKALEVIENRKKRKIENGVIIRMKFRLEYELGMIDEAFTEVEKIKKYLNSEHGLTDVEKKKTVLFLKYYTKLLRVKSTPEHKGLEDLKMQLDKSKVLIPNDEWLKEKVKEIFKSSEKVRRI